MCGATAAPGRVGGDRDLRSRALRGLRELWAAVLRRRRHCRRAHVAGRVARDVPRTVQYRGPHEHRRHWHRSRGAYDRRARSPHRQEPHRAVRRVGHVTGRGPDPATAARSRPAWGLRGAQHSGLAPYSFLDCRSPRQHRGGGRRWIYRIGDGGEPDPSRTLRDRAGKAAAGHASARSGGRGPSHGTPDREGSAAPSG